jgi:hypothetical protein
MVYGGEWLPDSNDHGGAFWMHVINTDTCYRMYTRITQRKYL